MKPILFTSLMVLNTIAGRKTQTRRPVQPQPDFVDLGVPFSSDGTRLLETPCPYGKPEDLLWVQEAYAFSKQAGDHPQDSHVIYRATDPDWETTEGWKWTPAAKMPEYLSRIFLRVERISVEPVDRITPEDVKAEGYDSHENFFDDWSRTFGSLNQMVWVIQFNVDEIMTPQKR